MCRLENGNFRCFQYLCRKRKRKSPGRAPQGSGLREVRLECSIVRLSRGACLESWGALANVRHD